VTGLHHPDRYDNWVNIVKYELHIGPIHILGMASGQGPDDSYGRWSSGPGLWHAVRGLNPVEGLTLFGCTAGTSSR
jgi:hypothetical protein